MASWRKYKTNVAAEDNAMATSPLPSPEVSIPDPAGEASIGVKTIEAQIAALRKAKEQQQEAVEPTAEDRRREWPQNSALAHQHVAVLNDLHREALDAGFADTSPDYFQFMNKRLATLSAQHPAPVAHVIEDMQRHDAADKQEEPREVASMNPSAGIVSAPVSRGGVSYSTGRPLGRLTLTPAEREHAKVAGISEAEYAKQKIRYEQMKEDGTYGDRR
jgi:hypothetical protein